MNKSETISSLATALSAAQGAVLNATKDATNPHFGKTYVSLGAVWEVVRPALAVNGLAVVQFPCSAEGKVGVETIITHSSGEWMSNEYYLPTVKLDPQAFGSAITYARRYALMAAIGVAPEDDDGQAATPTPRQRRNAPANEPRSAGDGDEYDSADQRPPPRQNAPTGDRGGSTAEERAWADFYLSAGNLGFDHEAVHRFFAIETIKGSTAAQRNKWMQEMSAEKRRLASEVRL